MAADDGFDPRAFIGSVSWRFAKTMPTIPHEYVVEGKNSNPDGFAAMLDHIKATGFMAIWGRHSPKPYVELDGWRYWITQAGSTRIINREQLPGQPITRV